jgi:hypothetical protein
MIIHTNNDIHGTSRRIERARRRLNDRSFGYTNHPGTGPALQAVLNGYDGKRYTVVITKEDMDALNVARTRWPDDLGAP